MKQQNFEFSIEIAKADVSALAGYDFSGLPEDTKAQRDFKNWILAAQQRIIENPALAKSIINCYPSNDGEQHTSRQHADSASQYGSDFWNSTSHDIGVEWGVAVMKDKQKAVDKYTGKKDMSSGYRVVRDYDDPNILYWVGGRRDYDYDTPPSDVVRVLEHNIDIPSSTLVPALSRSA